MVSSVVWFWKEKIVIFDPFFWPIIDDLSKKDTEKIVALEGKLRKARENAKSEGHRESKKDLIEDVNSIFGLNEHENTLEEDTEKLKSL